MFLWNNLWNTKKCLSVLTINNIRLKCSGNITSNKAMILEVMDEMLAIA